jgi:hypothetical protein
VRAGEARKIWRRVLKGRRGTRRDLARPNGEEGRTKLRKGKSEERRDRRVGWVYV